MKVALIGNMNNSFFSLTRYLRDRGIDARLLLLKNEHPHFHPSHDTFDLSYQNYTRQLGWGDLQSFFKIPQRKIRDDLEEYDFIIGCNSVPAFLHKINRRIDLFLPYGSDFYELPFLPYHLRNPLKKLKYYFQYNKFHRAQRKGIQEAWFINRENVLPFSKKILKKLNLYNNVCYFGQPAVYDTIYSLDKIKHFYDRSAWYHEFKKIRDDFNIVIFNHSRHIWKTHIDGHSYKGNDVLIRSINKFVKENPGIKVCLILFEYGPDVDASKILINELKIEENVRWFPLMSRKEIFIGLSLSDLGTGQFSFGAIVCGTILEALAIGKPVLHYKDLTLSGPKGLFDYPYIQVRTENDICEALHDYYQNPSKYQEIGREGGRWYNNNYARKCVDKYVQLIEAKRDGHFPRIIEQWKQEKETGSE